MSFRNQCLAALAGVSAMAAVWASPALAGDTLPDRVEQLAGASVLVWYQDANSPFASYGTGFAVDTLGHILTCSHVVSGVTSVTVAIPTPDGEKNFPAEVVADQPKIDAAILKVDYNGLPPVRFGDSKLLRMGQEVGFVGYPLGYTTESDLAPTLTMGHIAGIRPWRIHPEGPQLRMVQVDASVSIGTSGSALFDKETGVVIGMMKSQIHTPGPVLRREDVLGAIQAIPEEMAASAGIGLAVPCNILRTFLLQAGITH